MYALCSTYLWRWGMDGKDYYLQCGPKITRVFLNNTPETPTKKALERVGEGSSQLFISVILGWLPASLPWSKLQMRRKHNMKNLGHVVQKW